MMNYISPTLINSWLYCMSHEGADINDFMDYLKRVPKPTTEAQQRGLDFEDKVYKGEKENYNPYVKGGLYQVKVCKPYRGIMLLGIIDVLQPTHIYDVKTTAKYDIGKYYNTSQHKIYCYCTGIKDFSYLINEECYVETYHYKDGECEQLIDEFIDWLKATNLYRTWQKHWIKNIDEWKES